MTISRKICVIGTRVNCALYYAGPGVIYAIRGVQTPENVSSFSGGAGVSGGSAMFGIVYENGGKSEVPEAIVRGIQWTIYDEVASAEEIEALLKNADVVAAAKEKQAREEKEAFTAAVEALRTDANYADLEQGTDHSGKLAAKNIRKVLRKAFPAVTFSVRKHSYGSVAINWADGPTVSTVEALVLRYKTGHFDSMQDLHTSTDTPFTVVFGGCDYLSCQRSYSEALVERAITEVFTEYAGNLRDTVKPAASAYQRGDLVYTEVPGLMESLHRLISTSVYKMAA